MDIFTHSDYKVYVTKVISKMPSRGYGVRSRLAESLQCKVSHLSQVLNGHLHLSIEQAHGVNLFFEHNELESDYFLYLVQHARAGSESLREYYSKKIKELLQIAKDLKARIQTNVSLDVEHQAVYFSSWIYAAVHIAVTVPNFNTKSAIVERLNLRAEDVEAVLGFLVNVGLLSKSGAFYSIGTNRIHISDDSPFYSKSHLNWRVKAMAAIEGGIGREEFHYSSLVSISIEDADLIKRLWLEAVEKTRHIVNESREQEMYVMCMDLFKV